MMLNILIASDNNNWVELIFKEIIRKNNEFRLADYTNKEKDTLNSISQYRPDVIILNIINGMSIIESISSIEGYLPYVVFVSDVQEYFYNIHISKKIYTIINEENAFSKLIDNINWRLEKIYEEINNREIYNKINKELKKFKLNISSKGTNYLIDSILISYNKETLNLTKDVYPVLSKKYQVTPISIKWNMEKNIKSMRRYTDNDIIEEYFNISSRANLTIKTVVRTVSDNIEKTAYDKQSKPYLIN